MIDQHVGNDPPGPDDTNITAKVGEYMMPQYAVKFFGIGWMNRMREKARKAMGMPEADDADASRADGGLVGPVSHENSITTERDGEF